jgi:hypothetical protein
MCEGHVLVAKEKDPAGLVEFGPRGSHSMGLAPATLPEEGEPWALDGAVLDALAWWPLPDEVAGVLRDLSDLSRDHDGGVWLLGRGREPLGAQTGSSVARTVSGVEVERRPPSA